MKKPSNYNDGYIRVYEEIPVKTDCGAKKNIKTKDNLKFIVIVSSLIILFNFLLVSSSSQVIFNLSFSSCNNSSKEITS